MSAPVLPLGADAAHAPNSFHVGVVRAWMLFPDDAKMRDRAINTGRTEYALDLLKAGAYPRESTELARWAVMLIEQALDAPSPEVLMDDDRQERGAMAGSILWRALPRAARNEKGPMGRTMRDVEHVFTGRKSSESHYVNNTVWKIFRPVAALWASFVNRADDESSISFPCLTEDLPMFLAMAEGFRMLGETTRPPKRADPILKPSESLQLTDELRVALLQGTLAIPGL